MKPLTHRFLIWAGLGLMYLIAVLFFTAAWPGPAAAQEDSQVTQMTAAEYGVMYSQLNAEQRAQADTAFMEYMDADAEHQSKRIPHTLDGGYMTVVSYEWNNKERYGNLHTKVHAPLASLDPQRTQMLKMVLNDGTCSNPLYMVFMAMYDGKMIYTYWNQYGAVIISHTVDLSECLGGNI